MVLDSEIRETRQKMDERVRKNKLLARQHGVIIEDMEMFEDYRKMYVRLATVNAIIILVLLFLI
jgi:hypothetical protein